MTATITADIENELAAWDIHTLRWCAEEIEFGNQSTTTAGDRIEWTRAGAAISNPRALELMYAEIGRRRETITLDTPLADVAFDDAGSISEDLISTAVAGEDWGMAWDRILRADGTVKDLRDMLYETVIDGVREEW